MRVSQDICRGQRKSLQETLKPETHDNTYVNNPTVFGIRKCLFNGNIRVPIESLDSPHDIGKDINPGKHSL
jgi:hypothetical protein